MMLDRFFNRLFPTQSKVVIADVRPEPPVARQVPADAFLAPGDLAVTQAPPVRVLGIGSCFLETLVAPLHESGGTTIDFVLASGIADFPAEPPAEIGAYDYQIIQIPLRAIMHDDMFTHIGPRRAACSGWRLPPNCAQ
jgi:hypothetical protein